MDSYVLSLHVSTGCLSVLPNITEVVPFARCETYAGIGLLVESTPGLLFQAGWNHDRHRYEAVPFLTFCSLIQPKLPLSDQEPSFLRCFTSLTSASFPSGVILLKGTILKKDDFWRAAPERWPVGKKKALWVEESQAQGAGAQCV